MWAARNNDKKRINKIYRYILYLSNYWCITLILFYTDGKLKSQMISIWLVGDKGKKWWRRMRETCWRRLDHISIWTWGCLVHWVHLQGPRAQRGDKDGAGTAGKSSGKEEWFRRSISSESFHVVYRHFWWEPTPCSMWDLSFPTRAQTCVSYCGNLGSLNHQTAREVPTCKLFNDDHSDQYEVIHNYCYNLHFSNN